MRKCLFCGNILNGRSDKRFCDDNCRNNYHYKLIKDKNDKIKSINKILHDNRNILRSFRKETKTVINKQELINANFSFDYFTGIYKTRKNSTFYIIYDEAYCYIDESKLLIINYIK